MGKKSLRVKRRQTCSSLFLALSWWSYLLQPNLSVADTVNGPRIPSRNAAPHVRWTNDSHPPAPATLPAALSVWCSLFVPAQGGPKVLGVITLPSCRSELLHPTQGKSVLPHISCFLGDWAPGVHSSTILHNARFIRSPPFFGSLPQSPTRSWILASESTLGDKASTFSLG